MLTVVLSIDCRCMQVGVAQQWYDELDTLAFVTPESESSVEEDEPTSNSNFEYERPRIDCAVNTSPGTSEVCTFQWVF